MGFGATTEFGLKLTADTIGQPGLVQFTAQTQRYFDTIKKGEQEVNQAGSKFDRFGENVKNFIQDPLHVAGEAAEGLLKKVGPMGAALGAAALGAGILAKSIYDIVSAQGKAAEGFVNLAERTGLSVKEAEQYSAAAKIANTDINGLVSGVKILSQALMDGGAEAQKKRKFLKDLGVEAFDANGKLKSTGELIYGIGDAISRLPEGVPQISAITEIFGKGGVQQLPLLKNLPGLLGDVKKLGVGLDENLTRQLAKADDAFDKIELRIQQLKRLAVAPIVITIVEKMEQGGTPQRYGRRYTGSVGAMERLFGAGAWSYNPAQGRASMQPGMTAGAWLSGLAPAVDEDAFSVSIAQSRAGSAGRTAAWDRYFQTGNSLILMEQRLADARARLKEAELAKDVQAHQKAIAEIQSLEIQVAAAKESAKPFVARPVGQYGARSFPGTLAGPNLPLRNEPLVISEADIQAANAGRTAAQQGQLAAYGAGIIAAGQREEQIKARTLDHQIRMVELLSGPGGEVQAVERVYALRMAAAKTEEEAQSARYEMEERIAQIQKQRVEQWASTVSGAFNALVSGGRGGLGSFAKSQLVGMGSTVAGNAARMSYGPIQKLMPNAAEGSWLGSLLSGTPFGPDALQGAGAKLDTAGDKLIQAAGALSMSASGGGGGLVRGTFGGGYQGRGIFSLLSGGGGEDPYASENGELASILATDGDGWKKSLAGYGSLAAGGFGAYMGIKQGGVKGGLTAAGSLAGGMSGAIASGLFGASAASGPLAPILAGAALGIGMITSFFGDPKQKRGKEIEDWTAGHQNSEPVPVNIVRDTYGRERYEDFRGGMHSGPTIIYAMDAQSFTEFAERNPEGFNRGVRAMVNAGGEGVPALQSAMGLA